VWDFARGCMRTYLILKDKARQFKEDRAIQNLLAEIRGADGEASVGPYSSGALAALRAHTFDRDALASKRLPYERLDQLVIELLMGVR
jgi:xylose isomerase